MPLNVYLSSPYRQLKEARGAFLELIASRSILYKITAMEGYFPEDRRPLEKCLEDVSNCNIYVLIVGDEYGSIASIGGESTGKSYTHLEYDKANEEKGPDKSIERLIFLKTPPQPNEPPKLTKWKEHIKGLGVLIKNFNNPDELPQLILESLDNFVDRKIKTEVVLKDDLKQRIYLCDRKEVEQNFDYKVYSDNTPVNFFVLSGHENDLPDYFFERNKLKFIDQDYKWSEVKIQPFISQDITDFSGAEFYINNEIYKKLKLEWKKFRGPNDVTFEGLIEYMTETGIDYLAIIWHIEDVSLKNHQLGGFLTALYNKYKDAVKDTVTEKKILFFVVFRYSPIIGIAEEAFYEKANAISWKNKLPKLSKINIDDIKDWLDENEIKILETEKDYLIGFHLKVFNNNTGGVYYKDVETGLLNILKLYKN